MEYRGGETSKGPALSMKIFIGLTTARSLLDNPVDNDNDMPA